MDTLNSIKNQASNVNDAGTELTPSINSQASSVPEVVAQTPEVDLSSPEDLDEIWARWRCLVCGYNYEGRQTITKCPRCGNEDPDKFVDAD